MTQPLIKFATLLFSRGFAVIAAAQSHATPNENEEGARTQVLRLTDLLPRSVQAYNQMPTLSTAIVRSEAREVNFERETSGNVLRMVQFSNPRTSLGPLMPAGD